MRRRTFLSLALAAVAGLTVLVVGCPKSPTADPWAAAGNKPKIISEYIGRVNSKTEALSVARMQSPAGWIEPAQAA